MPFKSFNDSSAELLFPSSLPASFGTAPSSLPSANVSDPTPPPFVNSAEPDSRRNNAQRAGLRPPATRFWSLSEDSRHYGRSDSPFMVSAENAISAPSETLADPDSGRSHPQTAGQYPSSIRLQTSIEDSSGLRRNKFSPFRFIENVEPNPPLPVSWNMPSSSSLHTSSGLATSLTYASIVHDYEPQAVNMRASLNDHSLAQYSGASLSSRGPRSSISDNHITKARGKSPPGFHANDRKQKSPPPATQIVTRPSTPIQASNSKSRSSLPSQAQNVRTRQFSGQEQSSRLFASAIQQFRSVDDGRGISLSSEHQRDEQAKERRLRRFNTSAQHSSKLSPTNDIIDNRSETEGGSHKWVKGSRKVPLEVQNFREPLLDRLTDIEGPDTLAERDWQSAEAVLGSCPDMCPESERQERERKGDLDRLERLDGDRNQTSKSLAVKKYTRTAEKDPSLIRPLPVLVMTVEHLLTILNRGYDEDLLTVHNFLWDRMRAVRMDLRMQHIFNEQAIIMHEQMIRFHILAMHELCEYAKGEGFSEGFDAHLNIEQMNKASVDLFHMYDDFRKKGNPIATEAEFRGYYALLKLDKHPGYVVEPAELSLDLAKMTPEMRNASEVQFARQVARACRSGNYLIFFRLARNATYLQACLMHAHFSKLRSQALASLHSGLQKNQGIPVTQVEEWLAMEGEDIEALMEYHGFSLKNYEELYLVKEGPFLNRTQDFQTRRSRFVEEKRSSKIKDDVLTSGQEKAPSLSVLERVASLRRQSDPYAADTSFADEEMPDYEDEEQVHEDAMIMHDSSHQKGETALYREEELLVPGSPSSPGEGIGNFSNEYIDVQELSSYTEGEQDEQDEWFWMGKRRKSLSSLVEQESFDNQPDEHVITLRDKRPRISEGTAIADLSDTDFTDKDSVLVELKHQEGKERYAVNKVETDLGKVRLLARRWKVRAALEAEERQWRQKKLESARSSLHLGLPIQNIMKGFQNGEKYLSPVNSLASVKELDIVHAGKERFHKLQKMWTSLDVSSVVASILKQRNSRNTFLCWKLLLCSRVYDANPVVEGNHSKKYVAGEWLLSKLSNQRTVDAENAVGLPLLSGAIVSQGLVCTSDPEDNHRIPFYYIARDVRFKDGELESKEAFGGASGLLYLLLEGSPLSEERARLHALVNSLDSGVRLPLLVLCTQLSNPVKAAVGDMFNFNMKLIETELDLDSLDKQKIVCWSIMSILETQYSIYPLEIMTTVQFMDLNLSFESRNDGLEGFYSEDILKIGLSWLASNAPLQPELRCLHVQDLLLEHLQPSVESLFSMQPSEVAPEICVRIFNEALQKTICEINTTAGSCCPLWPPDELRKFLEEAKLVTSLLLPSPGWNQAACIQPVLEALTSCQLPCFPLMKTNLNSGGSTSLSQQKISLEQALHHYVNQISGNRHGDLLTLQVVNAIIQKGCIFKGTKSGQSLIPNWPLIFQHLYHMRLALLNSEPPIVVYVFLKQKSHVHTEEHFNMRSAQACSPHRVGLSLNDMIELESQEVAALKGNFGDKCVHGLDEVRRIEEEFVASQTARVMNSQALTEGTFEALERIPNLGRGERDFTALFELPSKEELMLQTMVDQFCRKVDQEITDSTILEDYQAQTRGMTKHTGQFCTVHNDCAEVLEKIGWSPHSKIFSAAETSTCHSMASPSWSTADGIDNLTKLLSKCETVQKDLDKKLGFMIEEAA